MFLASLSVFVHAPFDKYSSHKNSYQQFQKIPRRAQIFRLCITQFLLATALMQVNFGWGRKMGNTDYKGFYACKSLR